MPSPRYNPASPDFAKEEFPFYWLARVNAVYTLEMEKALKTIDLDVPSWRVLHILHQQRVVSVSEIALHAVAKLSTITKTVYRMKAQGLVETQVSPQDARVTQVQLTPAGEAAVERAALATQHIFQRSFEGLTPAQIHRLNESLHHILDKLSPRHAGPPPEAPAAAARAVRAVRARRA